MGPLRSPRLRLGQKEILSPFRTLQDSRTIYWYDQYCENYYTDGFKAYQIDAVMRDLDLADADVYAIYATNQWGIAYYNSAVLPHYPPLQGRDYFGEVTEALKRRGKKVVAYVNWLDSRHPEWRWQKLAGDGAWTPATTTGGDAATGGLQELPEYEAQGKGIVYKVGFGEWFCHCINSPRRDEIRQVAAEITGTYDVDALHLDMFFNPGICGCPSCRRDLAQIIGSDRITYEAVRDRWPEYLSWRHEVSASLIAELSSIAHAQGMAFMPNAWCPLYTDPLMAVSPAWWQHIDYYVTEAWLRLNSAYADIDSTTLVCKWLRALGVPGVLLVTGQHNPLWHTPLAPVELKAHAAVAKGNGRPIFGPCGVGAHPSTRTSEVGLRSTRQALDFYTGDAAAVCDREPVRHVGVVWSEDTRNFYEPGEGTSRYRFEFLGYCRSLLEGHRVFDLLLPENLLAASNLAGYELIILPNTACMSETLAELVRQYVNDGGRVLCTWDTSLCDPFGRQRPDFLLADVLGVHYAGKYPSSAFFAEHADEPIVVLGEAVCVTPSTADVLERLVAADPDYCDSGPDLIPGTAMDYPILTKNHYGLGSTWYVAGSVGYTAFTTGYYRTTELLAGFINRTGIPEWMRVDAPPTVDVSVERDGDGFLYIHLANKTAPSCRPARDIIRSIDQLVPVADIRLSFPSQGTAECVSPAGDELVVTHTDDGMVCLISRLQDYCLVKVRLTRGA